MSVVTFEELVSLDVPNHESGESVVWTLGGGVDLKQIASVGTFSAADRFSHANFNIRFHHAEKQLVESSNTTVVRKLHAALVMVWVKYSRDQSINPLLDFKE